MSEDHDATSKYEWNQLVKTQAIILSNELVYTITRLKIVEQSWPARVTPKSWVIVKATAEIDQKKHLEQVKELTIRTINGIPVEELSRY